MVEDTKQLTLFNPQTHLTKAIDVVVLGQMKGMYNKERPPLYIQNNQGIHITNYKVNLLLYVDHT